MTHEELPGYRRCKEVDDLNLTNNSARIVILVGTGMHTSNEIQAELGDKDRQNTNVKLRRLRDIQGYLASERTGNTDRWTLTRKGRQVFARIRG